MPYASNVASSSTRPEHCEGGAEGKEGDERGGEEDFDGGVLEEVQNEKLGRKLDRVLAELRRLRAGGAGRGTPAAPVGEANTQAVVALGALESSLGASS